MGCAASSRAAFASASDSDGSLAMQVEPWAPPRPTGALAVDDDTRVPVKLYVRLRRAGARCRAGTHALIFDERGAQRLRRPVRKSGSQKSAFTMGEAVRILGYVSRVDALGSSLVGSMQSVAAVSEDGQRYLLAGLGGRWVEEVELEAYEKAPADDSRASTAPSSTSSNPTSAGPAEFSGCASDGMIEICVL